MEVFERLRLARKKLNYTQEEFSRGLGVLRGSYSDMERGKVKMITESALMLLEINFGISRDWLLHGTGEMLISADSANTKDDMLSMQMKIKEQEDEIERLKSIIQKIKTLVA